jgi:hypothetical protein
MLHFFEIGLVAKWIEEVVEQEKRKLPQGIDEIT